MNIIERIHRDFFSQYEKIADEMGRSHSARTDSDVIEVNRGLMAAGFSNAKNVTISSDTEHNKLVRAYELYKRYLVDAPGYRFIARHQVVDLCRKYGLVWGDTAYFVGDIPARNAAHISSFKVNPDIIVSKGSHDTWNNMPVGDMKDTHFVNTFRWLCNQADMNGWNFIIFDKRVETHMSTIYREMRKRFVCRLQTIRNGFSDPESSRESVGSRLNLNGILEVRQTVDHLTMIDRTMVSIHTYLIDGLDRVLSNVPESRQDGSFALENVTFKIVANRELFDLRDRIINNDCEVMPAPQPEPQRWTMPDFEDPIVLAEVEGGYLIVTAWGGESALEEVVNYNNN